MVFKFLRSCARGGNLPLSEIIRGFCEKTAFIDDAAEDAEIRRILARADATVAISVLI